MTKTGRPPKVEGERRRTTGISLSDSEIRALQELAKLRGESQGSIVGKLVVAALRREWKKPASDGCQTVAVRGNR